MTEKSPHARERRALAAFAHRDFRLFFTIRFLSECALHMLAVAVGQHVYEVTRDPLKLGYVGLALFVPKFAMTLPAGHVADRCPRKRVILLGRVLVMIIFAALAAYFTMTDGHDLAPLYALLFCFGAANTLDKPSLQAALPSVVPSGTLGNAVTWTSASVQSAIVAGPALAGLIYAAAGGAPSVVAVVAAFGFVAALCAAALAFPEAPPPLLKETRREAALAGLRYVFRHRVLLGALSLDLFAVLFGGAVALMPVFANDILRVGAQGLGFLRAAPSVGAALMALFLARRPPLENAGKTFLACVFCFGAGIVLFGLSENFFLSLVCLVAIGAADMVSMVVRGVLVQVRTPPEMRGRVSAVSMVFIGASNELGEFESGVTASWFGTVPAVVLGGCLTMAVVAAWAFLFPELRALRNLDDKLTAKSAD